ncbi:MAG: hypothetical protein ACKOA8_14335, partial [Deltaproteobacteria bacterium]
QESLKQEALVRTVFLTSVFSLVSFLSPSFAAVEKGIFECDIISPVRYGVTLMEFKNLNRTFVGSHDFADLRLTGSYEPLSHLTTLQLNQYNGDQLEVGELLAEITLPLNKMEYTHVTLSVPSRQGGMQRFEAYCRVIWP